MQKSKTHNVILFITLLQSKGNTETNKVALFDIYGQMCLREPPRFSPYTLSRSVINKPGEHAEFIKQQNIELEMPLSTSTKAQLSPWIKLE